MSLKKRIYCWSKVNTNPNPLDIRSYAISLYSLINEHLMMRQLLLFPQKPIITNTHLYPKHNHHFPPRPSIKSWPVQLLRLIESNFLQNFLFHDKFPIENPKCKDSLMIMIIRSLSGLIIRRIFYKQFILSVCSSGVCLSKGKLGRH